MVKMKLTDIYVWAGICLTGNVQELGMFHWVREMVEVVPLLMCTAVPLCSPHCAHLISAVCPCSLYASAPYSSHVAVCPCSLYALAPYTSQVAVCPYSLCAPAPYVPLLPILPMLQCAPAPYVPLLPILPMLQCAPAPYMPLLPILPMLQFAPAPCMPLLPVCPYSLYFHTIHNFQKVHLKVWKSISWSQHHPSSKDYLKFI